MAVSQIEQRGVTKGHRGCSCLWQSQWRVAKAGAAEKARWEGCQVWLQLADTSLQRPTDSRPLRGTNEHHGTEYHQ